MNRLGPIAGDATAAILAAGPFPELGPYDYTISQTIILGARMGLAGCGSGLTRLLQTANAPVVSILDNANGAQLYGVTCIRTTSPQAGVHGVVVGATENVFIDDVESDGHDDGFVIGPTAFGRLRDLGGAHNLSHGLRMYNTAGVIPMQWDADDCLFEFNGVAGARFSAVVPGYATLGTWTRPTTFANGSATGGHGFLCEATVSGASLNDCRFSDVTFSTDNGHGIEFANTNGEHNVVRGGLVESAGFGVAGMLPALNRGCGIVLSGKNVETKITNLDCRANSDSGIAVVGSPGRVNITDNMISANGQWGIVGNGDTSNVLPLGNQMYMNKYGSMSGIANATRLNLLS